MKTLSSILLKPVDCLLITIPALAGPPLICQKFDIGSAKSLPWKAAPDWHGADPAYNLANLPDETLSLLTPAAPVRLRMETLRRAGIYSAKDAGLAGAGNADALEPGMVFDRIRCFAMHDLPGDAAILEIDRGDAAVGRLVKR